MTTFYDTAAYVREIDEETWVILKKILYFSRYFEKIPIEILYKNIKFSKKLIDKRIRVLHRKGFIQRFTQPYESIMLLTSGLDLIALKKLSDKELVTGIGRQIGTGKESDIYEVVSFNNNLLTLKVFRLGRISFKRVRLKRDYGPIEYKARWYVRNISAAKKEFINLKYVYRKGISVPRPIYHTLHIILMERLEGFILNDIRKLENPLLILDKIIYEIKRTYDAGIVNGDLSQFNIFISSDGRIYLIDWPQALSRKNEKALMLLKKDILNIVKFFIKRHYIDHENVCKIIKKYGFEKIILCKEIFGLK